MAKGWTQLNTVNDTPKTKKTQQQKNREAQRQNNFIRATKSLSVDKLKEAGDLHYAQHISEQDALLDAFENKRLKSKNLIKQAIKIKKDREKAEAKRAAAQAAQDQKKDLEPVPAE